MSDRKIERTCCMVRPLPPPPRRRCLVQSTFLLLSLLFPCGQHRIRMCQHYDIGFKSHALKLSQILHEVAMMPSRKVGNIDSANNSSTQGERNERTAVP